MKMNAQRPLPLVLFFALLFSQFVQASISYTVQLVGRGDDSGGAINNSGWVVTNYAAEIWDPSRGSLPTYTPPGALGAENRSLNNSNAIVGALYETDSTESEGFRTTGYYVSETGAFHTIDEARYAIDVNDAGQVVGNDRNSAAYIWDTAGGFRSIGKVETEDRTSATSINENGVVVGLGFTFRAGSRFGFTWTDEGGMVLLSSAAYSDARDINNQNYIAGSLANKATIWDDELQSVMLPSLSGSGFDSQANAINELNHAVGYGRDEESETTALLWRDGEVFNIEDLIEPNDPFYGAVDFVGALDINDLGQILATEYDDIGTVHYVLTPVVVPLPAAFWLFLSSLAGLFGLKRATTNCFELSN